MRPASWPDRFGKEEIPGLVFTTAPGEHLEGPAVGGGVEHDVQRPDLVGPFRLQSPRRHRAVAPSRRSGECSGTVKPSSLHSRCTACGSLSSFYSQHRPSPAETPCRPLLGDLPESLPQHFLRRRYRTWWLPLCCSRLAQRPACLPFAGAEGLDQGQYCCPVPSRAQKCTRDISLRISIWSSRSATIRFNRWF